MCESNYEKRRYLAAVIVDFLVFLLMTIGISFSLLGVKFMGDYPRISTLPILYTFTGLSNVFIGLVALASGIARLIKKDRALPKALFVIKLIALADITLTFVITAAYLAPITGPTWWRLYINSHLFNHLLTPVTAIVSFILLEKYVKTDWKLCFYTFVPIVLYAILYIVNVFTHLTVEGAVDPNYDLYKFFRLGLGVAIVIGVVVAIAAFGLTLLYRLINSKRK